MGTSREEEYKREVDSDRIRPGGLSSIFPVWLSPPLPLASSYVVRADWTYIITIKPSRRRNACSFEEKACFLLSMAGGMFHLLTLNIAIYLL